MIQNMFTQMQKTWDVWSDTMKMPVGNVESVASEVARHRAAAVNRLEELTDQWASSAKQSMALGASVVDSCQTIWTEWLERSYGPSGKPS
jgi:hypothetical protein